MSANTEVDVCGNCGEAVVTSKTTKEKIKGKNYRRTLITGKLRNTDKSPSDLFQNYFNISVTPDKSRFLCQKCTQLLQAAEHSRSKAETSLNDFTAASTPTSYLATKKPFSSTPVQFRSSLLKTPPSKGFPRLLSSTPQTPGTPTTPGTPVLRRLNPAVKAANKIKRQVIKKAAKQKV